MATKYHINREGNVSPCEAEKLPCPLVGAEHGEFESLRDARSWAEDVNFARAGGERGLLGFRKKTTPRAEAEESFDPLTVERGTRGVVQDKVAYLLGVATHDVAVGNDWDDSAVMAENDEIFVDDGSGMVRVYRYTSPKTAAEKTEGTLFDISGSTKERWTPKPAFLKPAALISKSQYADTVLKAARLTPDAPLRPTLARAFFAGAVEDYRSPAKGRVYKVFDGVEDRYFDGSFNDVTDPVAWEATAGRLKRADGSSSRSPRRMGSIVDDPRGALSGSAQARSGKTVESTKGAAREKKPRRTLKWHGEQPITAEENEALSAITTVGSLQTLPSDEARAHSLRTLGNSSSRTAEELMAAMRKSSISREDTPVAIAAARGSFFTGEGREVVRVTAYRDGTRAIEYARGARTLLSNPTERLEVTFVPSTAAVLKTLREGKASA